jgi:drug/metabolite transporter (DMT)-like permease
MALSMQATGLVPLLVLVALLEGSPDDLAALVPAAVGGAAGALALAAFYRAVRGGHLSVVAPIVGAGIAVPVVVGILRGDAPSTAAAIGLVVLLVGGLLVGVPRVPPEGRPPPTVRNGRPATWALTAALLSGAFYLGLDASAEAGPLAAVATARIAAVVALALLLAVARPPLVRIRDAAPLALLVGLVDVSANVFFTVGTDVGLLAVVAATAALYPLVAVVLARVVLHERLSGGQAAGVGVVLAGLVLVSVG